MKMTEMDSNWTKLNSVTKKRGNKIYDVYKHKSGAKGCRCHLDNYIELTDKDWNTYASWYKKEHCNVGRSIRIIHCRANGPQFKNLMDGSLHVTVETPTNQDKIDYTGVWVMGVGEPVKVLNDEFEYVD